MFDASSGRKPLNHVNDVEIPFVLHSNHLLKVRSIVLEIHLESVVICHLRVSTEVSGLDALSVVVLLESQSPKDPLAE